MRLILIAIASVLAVCLVAAYPSVHNRHIHPMGRLAKTVQRGASCEAVRKSFAAYARESGGPEVQFSTPVFETDLLHTRSVPPVQGASLYDLSVFDDLQLTARCGLDGRVAEVLFIAD